MQTRILTIAFATLLFACAASPGFAAKSKETAVPEMKAGQAQIVIMRSSQVDFLVGTEIYDVTTGEPRVVGKLSNNRKLVLDLPAGDYVFMVGNVPGFDFMKASVSADKRYFVIVAPHWPAHFSMRPIRHRDVKGSDFVYSSETFARLLKKTKLAPPVDEPMGEKERNKVAMFYTEQWNKWQSKTPEEMATLTLRPEDSYK